MALQGMDGCDLYSDTTDLQRRYPETQVPAYFTISTTLGRFGGGAIHGNNYNGYVSLPVSGTPTTYYWAGAMKGKALTADRPWLEFANPSLAVICRLTVLTGGLVRAYRGTGTTLGTSVDPVVTSLGYSFVEVKVVVSSSVGVVEVWTNGARILNITGANTEGQTGGISRIWMRTGDSNGWYLDDFYHYDTTGSGVTDFLGDREIETRRPNGDASVQFTRSGGAANYEMVDESPGADDDTTYNESGTVEFKDRLDLQDMARTPVSIDAVQAVVVDRKTGGGAAEGKVGFYSGTTEGMGAAEGLGTDYGCQTHIEELNPDDSLAWEEADVNALQIQYEHA